MIVFEELIDFRDSKMINDLQFMNLLLKEFSFCASYFILIDNVDSSGQSWYFVNGFSKLVKLILFQTWR